MKKEASSPELRCVWCARRSYAAQMSPDGDQTSNHAHHGTADHAHKHHFAVKENRLDEVLVDNAIGDPNEEQCQQSPEYAFDESIDEEGKTDEHVSRADQPHDRYLLGSRQHRHANRCTDDYDGDGGKRDSKCYARNGRDIPQPVEFFYPLLAVSNVVDEVICLHAIRD